MFVQKQFTAWLKFQKFVIDREPGTHIKFVVEEKTHTGETIQVLMIL